MQAESIKQFLQYFCRITLRNVAEAIPVMDKFKSFPFISLPK